MDRLKQELKSMPDPPAGQFQQTLRRDLLAAMQPAPSGGLKAALAASATAALVLAGTLVLFVISPDVPQRIHTAWLDREQVTDQSQNVIPAAGPAPGRQDQVQQAVLRQFLEQSDAGVGRDRDFLETWYSSQARPARIKAVQHERLLAIRQFELANGQRVAVLTDLGATAQSRSIGARPASTSGRTY